MFTHSSRDTPIKYRNMKLQPTSQTLNWTVNSSYKQTLGWAYDFVCSVDDPTQDKGWFLTP